MVRNGPQSLDANDVMVNARGLPGGMLKIRIGHFGVSPGLCFKTRVGAQPLIWSTAQHLLFDCSRVLEYAKIRTVLQSIDMEIIFILVQ